MAKEIAISKKLKISEAQQYMLLAVVGASVILGVAISFTLKFIDQISYNVDVIMAQDESIVDYSDFIKNVGICKSPKGTVYTTEELKNCDPNNINVSELPNTLRSNILTTLASNEALNSVDKSVNSECYNAKTGKEYTYDELEQAYQDATTSAERIAASTNIRNCSALRIIPDALPSVKNEEALLASLNQIFNISGWEPESLSPSSSSTTSKDSLLNSIAINLSVESNTAVATSVLRNVERSIREFDITSASIEWSGTDGLSITAAANAYYTTVTSVAESETSISTGQTTQTGGKTK